VAEGKIAKNPKFELNIFPIVLGEFDGEVSGVAKAKIQADSNLGSLSTFIWAHYMHNIIVRVRVMYAGILYVHRPFTVRMWLKFYLENV
jgi:hypothetical protein